MSAVESRLAAIIAMHELIIPEYGQFCICGAPTNYDTFAAHLASVIASADDLAVVEVETGWSNFDNTEFTWDAGDHGDLVFLDHDGVSVLMSTTGSGEAQLGVPSDPVALASALVSAAKAAEAVDRGDN